MSEHDERHGGGLPAEHRLTHDGRFGELFVVFLVNLLLTIVTLGVYRFWGKTRIRRYVWSHTAFMGDRLEYDGRGLELFLGFLFALAVLGLPLGGWYAWFLLDPPHPGDLNALLLRMGILYAFIFALFYLTGVAVFAAQRYRSSRTRWRGIRGGLEGSAWTYGALSLGLTLLNLLSLGWTKPWADVTKLQYRLERAHVGSVRLASEIPVRGLYGPYSLMWCVTGGTLLLLYLAAVWIYVSAEMGAGFGPMDPTTLVIGTYVALFFTVVLYYLTVQWYWARLLRNTAAGTRLDAAGFRMEVTYGELLGLNLPNLLLLVFSLGLLYPLVILRTTRFIARHLAVTGEIDTERMGQYAGHVPGSGEGLMEFLGIGGI